MISTIIDSMTYRIAAAVICITCLFYSTMMRRRYRIRSRLFLMLVIITLIDSLTGAVSFFAINSSLNDTAKWFISYGTEMAYYVTHIGMMPVFVFYVICVCGVIYRFSPFVRNLLKFPIYALCLIIFTNPFTEFYFKISGKFQYSRGFGIYIAYMLSALYLVFAIVILIRYWYTINHMKQLAMVYFLSLVIIGTVIQMLFPSIKCELLCEAIGLSGIMIMIEKDDDRTDFSSGAYNRMAFVQDMKSLLNLKREFKVICVRFENLDMYRKFYGGEIIDKLMNDIAAYLMDDGEETNAYHTAFSSFYIIYPSKGNLEIQIIAKRIIEHMGNIWDIDGKEILLDCRVLVASCPSQFNSVNDIFLLETTNLKKHPNKLLIGEELNFLLRMVEVEKAIGRGISEKGFTLYFYPVYAKENYNIKLAQAWLKLKDSELGEISANEFTQIASTSGFIEEIQIRTVESVIRFLSNGVDKSDMQIDYVLIPIFSASILTLNMVKRINDLIKHFGIDPSLVAFVLKESEAHLVRNMLTQIKGEALEMGIRLFISEYEAGLLGLNPLTEIAFEGVILNLKSIFESENREAGDIVLTNRTNMIKQLDKTIIITGVDTMEDYDKIKNVQYDFVQGALFSGIVSKNELQNKFWRGERIVITESGVSTAYEDD